MVQTKNRFLGLLGALVLLPMFIVFPAQHKTAEAAPQNIVFDLTGVLFAKTGVAQRTANHQMVKLVKQLRHAGKRVFVLSNMPKGIAEKLIAAHVFFSVFDGIMFSYQVHVQKPDARIFRLFFEKFNLKPETCFFVDDLEQNVLAAEKLGMSSICFCGYDTLIKELKARKIM